VSDGNSGINGTVPEELAFLPRLKEFYVHGTAVIGNLDLLFCTGEVSTIGEPPDIGSFSMVALLTNKPSPCCFRI
jgi:hypothetical protein